MFRTASILLLVHLSWQTSIVAQVADSSAPIKNTSSKSSLHRQLEIISRYKPAERLKQKRLFLTRILSRVELAGNVALKIDEFEKFKLEVRQLRRATVTGNVPSDSVLKNISNRVLILENHAIEKLSLDYRLLLYNTFRQERQRYESRKAMGQAVMKSWKSLGRPDDRHDELLLWFQQAIAASRRENIKQLPQLPNFVIAVLTHQKNDQLPKIATNQPSRNPMKPEPTTPKIEPSNPRKSYFPPLARLRHPPEKHFTPAIVHPGKPKLSRPEFSQHPLQRKENTSELSKIVAGDHQNIVLNDLALRKTPQNNSIESVPDNHSSVDSSAAFVRTRSPVSQYPLEPIVIDKPEVKINTKTLIAKIAGYNQAMAMLEQSLRKQTKVPLSGADLANIMDQLDDMVVRHNDLLPYYNLAPKTVQPLLTRLVAPASLSAILAQRITQSRQHLQSDRFSGTSAGRELGIELTDLVSRRLAEMVSNSQVAN